jgi:hypothetical protein
MYVASFVAFFLAAPSLPWLLHSHVTIDFLKCCSTQTTRIIPSNFFVTCFLYIGLPSYIIGRRLAAMGIHAGEGLRGGLERVVDVRGNGGRFFG